MSAMVALASGHATELGGRSAPMLRAATPRTSSLGAPYERTPCLPRLWERRKQIEWQTFRLQMHQLKDQQSGQGASTQLLDQRVVGDRGSALVGAALR